ncbi:MAG: Imm40 family immunity protein [Methylococcaceae bacterium]|uniref:Imm40 family immunity protein n=1 Tax=Methylicorpusculum sp. TaxID=2713644 RepID=UPI00274F81B7|nr:Imm40 family immunity protein [Methylicorpusculum sp.]MDP3391861.1 Imm40 family immunity protein [Methylococcaceae bacterium]MDP3932858.1 Imm40 family immunity protein [Methylococcaceae bacterium]MDZ4151303.1 Imm40 family immunity protein [Methylicorpusculum sp.]
MEKYWSSEADMILGVGRSLEDVGVRNWALSREAALAALIKFSEIGIAVLGGDVYSINDGVVESNYDNWYCNRDNHESNSAYVERSIAAARNYIENYRAPEGTVLFAIVPKI